LRSNIGIGATDSMKEGYVQNAAAFDAYLERSLRIRGKAG
jgi:hypothetical protein